MKNCSLTKINNYFEIKDDICIEYINRYGGQRSFTNLIIELSNLEIKLLSNNFISISECIANILIYSKTIIYALNIENIQLNHNLTNEISNLDLTLLIPNIQKQLSNLINHQNCNINEYIYYLILKIIYFLKDYGDCDSLINNIQKEINKIYNDYHNIIINELSKYLNINNKNDIINLFKSKDINEINQEYSKYEIYEMYLIINNRNSNIDYKNSYKSQITQQIINII